MHEDTRFVSRWELRLDGQPLALLKSAAVDYDSAAFFLTNPETPHLRAHSVAVRRLRLVGGGLLEQIEVFNTASESISCELRLLCAADFADLFEIKSSVRDRSATTVAAVGAGGHALRFRYQVPGFLAETTIRIERSALVDGATEDVVAEVQPRVEGRRRLGARAAAALLVPGTGQGRRAGEQRHLRAGGRGLRRRRSPSRGR